jgi:hypothetical protein
MTKKLTTAQRTQAVLDYFKGKPGEFYMLKGLLIAPIAIGQSFDDSQWEARAAERKASDRYIDTGPIAARMDAINSGSM